MIKISLTFLINLLCISTLHSQVTDPKIFYPHQSGNVWQYRTQSMDEIVYTRYTDSVSIDSTTKEFFLHDRYVSGSGTTQRDDKLDSLHHVYNLTFQPKYVRYKLAADSGDTWRSGTFGAGPDTVPIMTTVLKVTQAVVFGESVKVKIFRHYYQIAPPPIQPITIGVDHLAEKYGLIRADVEPSEVQLLKGVVIDGISYGVILYSDDPFKTPETFDLITNYPNPFNDATVISYSISSKTHVDISIYDLLGRKLTNLVSMNKSPGRYQIQYKPANLTSGIYFAVIKTAAKVLTHKMVQIK